MASSIPLRPGMEQIQPREPAADHCKTQVYRWKKTTCKQKLGKEDALDRPEKHTPFWLQKIKGMSK